MMGYLERVNLYKTCKTELQGKGVAIEFGAFLGASASAIQAGLRANNLTKKTPLHIVDYFRSDLCSEFTLLTRNIAKNANQELLLYEKDGWLFFDKVFLANMDIKDTNLHVHQTLADNLSWESQSVEFLHLDLPKDWKLAYPIAKMIFPDLIVGAKVLLQDYGYQWSAELIAMVGKMYELGLIKPYKVTDTTLSVEVIKKITLQEINAINSIFIEKENVVRCIDIARNVSHSLSTVTDNTLLLAKAQYQFANGNFEQAFGTLSQILTSPYFSADTKARMHDLFEKNFSPDKSYEKSEEKGAA